MAIRIGANPIGWSNDDDRTLGADISLEQCLSEARAAGFEGMELGHKFPREPEALTAVLAAHDLALISGWYSSQLLQRDAPAEIAALQDHLRLLKALDASVMVFAETSNATHGAAETPLSERPQLAPGEWTQFGRRLSSVGEALAAAGLRLAYHHHMGTVVQSEEDIDNLMAHSDEHVHLLLDTGHATFAGVDPVALARRYRERICHVHCKDLRAPVMERVLAEDLSFLDAVKAGVFTVPGDGCVDFAAVLSELEGYSGWLVVEAEQDPRQADPATYAKLGYENLRRFAGESGLTGKQGESE
jgi:myo-inosose-2 dehydratase